MSLGDMIGSVKRTSGVGIVVLGAAMLTFAGYSCGKKGGADRAAQLATQLAQSEKTLEVKDGLYATKVVEMRHLQDLLGNQEQVVIALHKQLDDTQAQLLTTQQVAVKWKSAYEAELKANQSDGGAGNGSDGGPTERKRVDFAGDLGPIHAEGHTLTDPPEAHLKLDQIRPLVLTVTVAKNRDGTWQSYVTSSEPNMQVDVNLAGVDPGVTSPTWRQRIWADAGVDFLAGQRASAGLSYHFDSWSLGASCSVWSGGSGCGLTAGFRLFR